MALNTKTCIASVDHELLNRKELVFPIPVSPTPYKGLPPSVAPNFIRVVTEKDQGESVNKMKVTIFYNLKLKVTSYYFCQTILIRSKSLEPAHIQEEGITQEHAY